MKSIPIALQDDYNEDATTLCLITRILTKDGDLYGFTNLDVDIEYDPSVVDPEGTGDNWGSAVHRSDNGFTPSRIQASADLAVDNAELSGLVQDTGITEAQIRAGLFDYAKVRVYQINYMDTSKGHELVQSGTAGETRFSANGWKTEFRSLTQQLKQPISPGYSITCRARFGSKVIGTDDGSFEEAHPCGMAFTWVTGTITSLGSNARRIFSDSALTQATGFFSPGVVEILDGPNAGAQMEVDDFTADAFTLALQLPYALTVGTAYRVRQDCSKIHDDADHGCLYHFGPDWIDHFQGEPDIPVADGGANMIPGAQITRS
jgi:uncharacterized phage protein (TIGR02218 family)